MRSFLPFLVVGLASGSVYAIAALGLVVTYKVSGMFNFAHGAIGMAATFVFYSLRVEHDLPTWFAAGVAILVVGPLLGVMVDRLLIRRVEGASSATYVVIALGLLVALQGFFIAVYGPGTRLVDPLFPKSTFALPGVNVGWDQLTMVIIAAASGAGLVLFFRTRFGLVTRAVVGDGALGEISGVDTALVRTTSWMLGGAFAALSGVLLAPVIGVQPVLLTLLVIQAFGAAVVGRLTSLPYTYLGAIVIGVGASLATKFVSGHPALPGLPTSLPFIVLFAILVFSRKGSFPEPAQSRLAGRRGAAVRLAEFPARLFVPLLAVALILPGVLSNARLLTATSCLAFVLIFASLGLLVGLARHISLAHGVFVAFGATTLAHLHGHLPYLPALLLAGLVLVLVGALVAIPAIRLSGLFLALATFGFGVLAQQLLFPTSVAFGRMSIVSIPRPELFGVSLTSDKAFYYFVLAVVSLGVLATEVVRHSRLGRILRALADSPTAMQSLGVNPVVPRVLVFCLSAFLAAIGGGLLGTLTGSVNGETFDFTKSLLWVTVLVTGGASTIGGAILGAILLVALPTLTNSANVLEWLPVGFGLAAILLAQAENGLAGLLRKPNFASLERRSAWRAGSRRMIERMEAV